MLVPRTDRRSCHYGSYMWTLLVLALLLQGCSDSGAGARHIKVVMKKYAIEPPVIQLHKGETVVLDVYSADVEHGFEVPALGINEPVHRNFPAKIVLKPQKKGEFAMRCSVLCGPGHDDMTGRIVVE